MTVSKETDIKKPAKEVTEGYVGRNPKDVLKVKNLSDRPINLGNGTIQPDSEGKATVAEAVQHEARIKEV